MIRKLYISSLSILMAMTLGSCVHQFPEAPKEETITISLHYSTDNPQWEYPIEGTDSRTEVPSKSVQTDGEMRYIIRLYPRTDSKASRSTYSHEFTFTRDIAYGYDANFDIVVPEGDYSVMVWSDLDDELNGDHRFYDITDFAAITLKGDYEGNNDYRDAFRGFTNVSITSDIVEHEPMVVDINMERPLAKFEFITSDVREFANKEIEEARSRGEIIEAPEFMPPSKLINFDTYRVVFYYIGFMPNTFNMFSDKPIDSTTGVNFDGVITLLNNEEASMGFDYVFVNGVKSTVTIQVGLFDSKGNRLSMSEPINVPLIRSKHTLLKGKFLMQNAEGGVGIDPSFDGEFNITL